MRRKRSRKKGFTLLEIMVSVTILALITLMVSRIFSASSRAIERGKAMAMLDETARLLLDIIERDISQALVRPDIAFRVHEVAGGDALYFTSTGIRHQTETIPRDTAPMRLKSARSGRASASLVFNLNRYLLIESANGTENSIDNVIRSSDYYFANTNQLALDFKTLMATGETIPKSRAEYTATLAGTAGVENHAALSFMNIVINADPNSNFNPNHPADTADLPRFVDVVIGLVPSAEMAQAMRLYTAQNEERGKEYIAQYEKIYTRRIFLRNTGAGQLSFHP